MASKKWSATRISTYRECPLKYYYTYVKKWTCSKPADTEAADKGLVFHETVENYHTGMEHDALFKILESKIAEYKVDTTKYDEHGALERFFLFWNEFVAKKELAGFEVKQESWANGIIEGENFCGALDLFLDRGDKCYIFDYKSAKTCSASKYKNQLVLYAYLIGQSKGWTNEQIAENIKLVIFFPLSEQSTPVTMEDKMLASVKEIKFTAADVEKIIGEFIQTIKEIKATDWENMNFDTMGNCGFTCRWCPFIGSIPNNEGFRGCTASYDMGYRQERGVKYTCEEKPPVEPNPQVQQPEQPVAAEEVSMVRRIIKLD